MSTHFQAAAGAVAQDEDDAVIANIQFGGPKVRRLEEADDSDSARSTGSVDLPVDAARKLMKGKGVTGEGKKRADGATATEAAPRFQPVRTHGGGTGALPTAGDTHGDRKGGEEPGAGDVAATAAAPGSLLVSGIEAQARREAEKAKAAAAGSTGTKVTVKRKKKREKGEGAGGTSEDAPKKRKKHKRKEKQSGLKESLNGGVGETSTAAKVAEGGGAGAVVLGGLNLLGSYDSSSGSDDAAR